jgi:hypothetical protein
MTAIATLTTVLRVIVTALGLPLAVAAILAFGDAAQGGQSSAVHAQGQVETAPVITADDLLKLTEKEVVEKHKSKSSAKARA